ncbi:hypothetical protein NPX13_g11374 [Xylaria arbuscula]|uniref:Uncharacterized protein n=1 Tax=Xylaria arbuscula TaxID=114810 RepID=A0A9W8TH05_9PEZI|nr:hypothetical protein NPX13_g11374 [Xylaria arbuscula]
MIVGPHIERKKYRNPSQRRLTSSGGDTVSVGGSSTVVNHVSKTSTPTAISDTTLRTKENEKPNVNIGGSIITVTHLDASSRRSESGYELSPVTTTDLPHNWNHTRYQREDEELWGPDLSRTGHKLMDAIKHAGSSAGRFLESSLNKDARQLSDDEDEGSRYFHPIPPPVNDYHPPIIRRNPLKGSVRWMIQPPPPAKLMEGKVPVSRGSSIASRSTTIRSRYSESGLPASRGSSTSNLSRHPRHGHKIIDGVAPPYGSPANDDLSSLDTSSEIGKAGGPMAKVEF